MLVTVSFLTVAVSSLKVFTRVLITVFEIISFVLVKVQNMFNELQEQCGIEMILIVCLSS